MCLHLLAADKDNESEVAAEAISCMIFQLLGPPVYLGPCGFGYCILDSYYENDSLFNFSNYKIIDLKNSFLCYKIYMFSEYF